MSFSSILMIVKKTKIEKNDMINITTSHDNFNAFGGLALVFNALSGSGLLSLVRQQLGQRGTRCTSYSYADVFKALTAIYLSGGECLEDIEVLRNFWSREERLPSPDVIGRALKELAVGNCREKSEAGQDYRFNLNTRLNDLLVKSVRKLGLVDTSEDIVIDFDHQLIESECEDAAFGYKGFPGMFPGVAAIGGAIVHVENRDGNTPVRLAQHKTLGRMFGNLEKEFQGNTLVYRADAGSYSRQIIETVMKHCDRFYIRANASEKRRAMYREHDHWEDVELKGVRFEVASFYVSDVVEGKQLRLVVQRKEINPEDIDLLGKHYVYRAIVTNDFDMQPLEVIDFYNQRGACERNFDMQNNDFGWANMPFSRLDENEVFLAMTALVKNFYIYFIRKIAGSVSGLEPTSRVKKFVRNFIAVPAKWIRSGRRLFLKLITPHNFYSRLALLL